MGMVLLDNIIPKTSKTKAFNLIHSDQVKFA